ncbi:hypothetical protein Tco_0923741 [Tanacetum coccineum]|uniref:Uncharacterized protein n=1 Tax=Tanacetum coccineum TaxID=301880 RepID=A0ABQ5D397_9ASTR
MSTYLKNMAGYKHNQLTNKSFDDIETLFYEAMKRVNTFLDMDTELVEGSKVRAKGSETRAEGSFKRAGEDLQQESTKKQKVDEDKETAELQSLMEVILEEEEVTIDDIPLATKPASIKYGTNRPKDAYDIVLWSDLRTMFDPPLNEDAIWSLPLQQKMVSWRYYDKCEVHCLTLEACTIYMLADRRYPLSKDACQVMLKMKLLDGKMNEVCYKLLKMIANQAGIRK